MKFTKINPNTFKQLQLNAGILLSSFTPSSPTVTTSDILAATTGGLNFKATPSFLDFGADVDNAPKNTKELTRLDEWDTTCEGTMVTVTTAIAKKLAAAADIDSTDTSKIVPRRDLKSTDFADLWIVGDYSDVNDDTNGGFIAIHMINTLSTGGFQMQTADKDKGKFAFSFKAHYSLASPDTVPFELYVKAGTTPTPPST